MNMNRNQIPRMLFGERNLNFDAFADVTPAGAATASSFTDVLGGLITAMTPAANVAVTNAIAGPNTAQQNALMAEYLQGKLPGYHINPTTGQLEPIPTNNWAIPLMLIGGAGLIMLLVAKGRVK